MTQSAAKHERPKKGMMKNKYQVLKQEGSAPEKKHILKKHLLDWKVYGSI